MGDGWRQLPLGKFVTLQRGHDLPDEQRRTGTVPIVGSFGITGWHDQARARGPGVAVGRSGASFGVATYSPQDFWPLNTALYVINFHGNDERFAYYFLKNFDFKLFNSGSAQPSLNRNYIHPVIVNLPPPTEQRAIARILGALDDKIELNRRMNETLEAMARALFKSWFVDSSEKWESAPLSDLAGYLSRGIGPAYLESGGIRVLNQKCIRDRRVSFEKARRHDPAKRSVEGRQVQLLDVVVNSTGVGTLGRVAQIWRLPEPAVVDSHVTIVRAAPDVDPWFLGLSLLEREEEIEGLGEGSTGQTELSRDRLGALAMIRPPHAIQVEFGHLATPLIQRLSLNEEQSEGLTSLRDTLLPKLISGELRVKDAEKIAERAA